MAINYHYDESLAAPPTAIIVVAAIVICGFIFTLYCWCCACQTKSSDKYEEKDVEMSKQPPTSPPELVAYQN